MTLPMICLIPQHDLSARVPATGMARPRMGANCSPLRGRVGSAYPVVELVMFIGGLLLSMPFDLVARRLGRRTGCKFEAAPHRALLASRCYTAGSLPGVICRCVPLP
jgi:hypothetical protein